MTRTVRTLHDGWILTRRELIHLRHEPGELVVALVFPGLMVLMFGYLFGSAIAMPAGNYREYFLPGLLAMTAVLGVGACALQVSRDVADGIMDRFRSMPVARSAVPFGRAAADVITSVVNLAATIGIGLAIGWRAHRGLACAIAAVALILLLRYAVGWIGVFVGLCVKPKTADSLVPLGLPIAILSNSFVPTADMPAWLRLVVEWNPVSALVAACRELFGNPVAAGSASLPLQHPVAATVGWSVLLLVVFVPLATWRYNATSR